MVSVSVTYSEHQVLGPLLRKNTQLMSKGVHIPGSFAIAPGKFYLSVEEHVKTQQENCGRSNLLSKSRIDFYMVLMTKKKCFFKIFHKYCLISLKDVDRRIIPLLQMMREQTQSNYITIFISTELIYQSGTVLSLITSVS